MERKTQLGPLSTARKPSHGIRIHLISSRPTVARRFFGVKSTNCNTASAGWGRRRISTVSYGRPKRWA